MGLFENINQLERSLNASSQRQKLITNNIANVDTPGYKTMDISFKDILDNEKSKNDSNKIIGYKTDSRHFNIGQTNTDQVRIEVEDNTSLLNNENNVDIDYEMTKLSENNIWYSSLTQAVNKEFSLLRYVITDGRR